MLFVHQVGKYTLKLLSGKDVSRACVQQKELIYKLQKTLSMLEESETNNSK